MQYYTAPCSHCVQTIILRNLSASISFNKILYHCEDLSLTAFPSDYGANWTET
jgi:hypothetical protein